MTKKKLLIRSLATAGLSLLLLFSLAACGNSRAQATSTSTSPQAPSPGMQEAEGTSMSEAFQRGGIWFLSSPPSPSAQINQAFYFEGGKLTVFQYLYGSGIQFKDLSGSASQEAKELRQWDQRGWNSLFPGTPYKKPVPTSYSLQLLTNEDGKEGAVEILEDPSVVDPVDGEGAFVFASQNENALPQGDFLYLPLTTLSLANSASSMGKVAPLSGPWKGYLNWNTLMDNVAQDVQLSSPTIDTSREWLTTLSSSKFRLDSPKEQGVEVHGKLSISESLAKNTRMA
ncbi:MAG: hypothetical protein IKT06_03020 [Aeriscardovia sp.]|nr:hypothetical protein [Aeriscardovia sp.]